MTIVPISKEHWRDLKNVRLASLRDSPNAFGVPYDAAAEYSDEEWMARASGEAGPVFFIAYEAGRPIGLVGGIYANGEYELISMWVAPEHRRSGVAKQLVEALKDRAVEDAYDVVILKVSPDNASACQLYSRCGFRAVGVAGELISDGEVYLQRMEWSTLAVR